MVERVAERIFIPFTVGGGIRRVEDFTAILRAGADKVSVNSAALQRPELIREAAGVFGSQCVVVAMDAKRRPGGGWTLYLNGGRIDTGRDAVEWAKEAEELGAGEILLTSMDRDGVKTGYDLELTRAVSEAVGIPVIASGGAGGAVPLLRRVYRWKGGRGAGGVPVPLWRDSRTPAKGVPFRPGRACAP